MTATRTATRTARSTAAVYRDHLVTGTPVQLANIITNHRAAGTLVAHSHPRPAPDGRFQLQMRLIEHVPARQTRRATSVADAAAARTRRRSHDRSHGGTRTARRVTLAVVGTAAVVAGLGYLTHWLIQLIAANWPMLLGIATVALLITAALGRTGAVHCPGCPR